MEMRSLSGDEKISAADELRKYFTSSILFLIPIGVLVFPTTISEAQATDLSVVASLSVENTTHFMYSRQSFNTEDNQFISSTGDASINQGALQVTPDSSNRKFSLFNRSGRSMLRRSFRIWDAHKIISFTSIFDINVSPPTSKTPPGEGLAFVIASNLQTPTASSGGYLGLTNQRHDGYPSNQFIAIELDTNKGDKNGDPNNNHMGLNINSIQSNKTVNLTDIDIDIASGKNYTVWIQYDGKTLDVYMGLKDKPKPDDSLLKEVINLKDHLNEYSNFGFSASTGTNTAQLNCILRWDLTVEILPEDKGGRKWLRLIGLPGLVIFFVIGVVIIMSCYYLHKRKKKVKELNVDISVELQNLHGVPKKYPFEKLKNATNNFDDKMKLGQGGFGAVYKGVLPNDSEYIEIAVKKFFRERLNGKFDFLAELKIINRLRHKHLVRLAGWCYENEMLLLVYEFMPNGSLDKYLSHGSDKILKWKHRYKIASGVAKALHYLHNEYEQKVVHRDLKPGNILLDSDYNARLGDFGLARLIEHGRNSFNELEGFAGTPGYIAPECFYTGKATKESDVFGFGVVVLELVCGRRPRTSFQGFVNLVDWVWGLHGENRILEAIDARLGSVYVVEEAHRLLLLGLCCSHPIASERPKTENIFQIISGSIPVPSVSLEKPLFVQQPTDQISSTCTDETEMKNNEEESAYYTPKSIINANVDVGDF